MEWFNWLHTYLSTSIYKGSSNRYFHVNVILGSSLPSLDSKDLQPLQHSLKPLHVVDY